MQIDVYENVPLKRLKKAMLVEMKGQYVLFLAPGADREAVLQQVRYCIKKSDLRWVSGPRSRLLVLPEEIKTNTREAEGAEQMNETEKDAQIVSDFFKQNGLMM